MEFVHSVLDVTVNETIASMKSRVFTLGLFIGRSCCLHEAAQEGEQHFLQSKQTASSSKLGIK